jgi:hypothetical protein
MRRKLQALEAKTSVDPLPKETLRRIRILTGALRIMIEHKSDIDPIVDLLDSIDADWRLRTRGIPNGL